MSGWHTVKLELTIQIERDGADPGEEWVKSETARAIQEAIPHVLIDSDEKDCILFVSSTEVCDA